MKKILFLIILFVILINCANNRKINDDNKKSNEKTNNFYFIIKDKIYSIDINGSEMKELSGFDNKNIFALLSFKNEILFYTTLIGNDEKITMSLNAFYLNNNKKIILLKNIKNKVFVDAEDDIKPSTLFPLYFDNNKNELYYFFKGLKTINIKNKKINNIYNEESKQSGYVYYVEKLRKTDDYMILDMRYYEGYGYTLLKNNKEIKINDLFKDLYDSSTDIRYFPSYRYIEDKYLYIHMSYTNFENFKEEGEILYKINLNKIEIEEKKDVNYVDRFYPFENSEKYFLNYKDKNNVFLIKDEFGEISIVKKLPKIFLEYNTYHVFIFNNIIFGNFFNSKNEIRNKLIKYNIENDKLDIINNTHIEDETIYQD